MAWGSSLPTVNRGVAPTALGPGATTGTSSWGGNKKTSPLSKSGMSDLLSRLIGDYEESRAMRRERFGEGMKLLEGAAELYKPGGAFEQAAMQTYESGKRRALSGGMQGLISSGLAKGSTPAAMERGYETTVGTPYRIGVAAEGQGRLAQAMGNMAGYLGGFQDLTPTPGTLAHLSTGGFGALTGADATALQAGATAAGQTAANRAASTDYGLSGSLLGGGGGRLGTGTPFGTSPFRSAITGSAGSTGGTGGTGDTSDDSSTKPLAGQAHKPGETSEAISQIQMKPLSEPDDLPETITGPFTGGTKKRGNRTYYWTGSYYKLAPATPSTSQEALASYHGS